MDPHPRPASHPRHRGALRRRFAALALAVVATAAQAGRDCEARAMQVDDVRQAMAMAERTARALDASGAGVVVLARAGQDLRRHGLQWSHLGLAYRDAPGAPWRVVHKLNHCGTAEAAVYRQGLGEFFLDRPWRYEAAYAVPAPAVQARLHPLLRDDRRAVAWHEPAYSMVAYPWSQRYQQSNQWAIETLAGAMEPAAGTRRQAQSWLQLHDYRPTTLRLGALTRLGASVSRANIAFDDHPPLQRFSDRIDTVTADSVFDWLGRDGLAGPPVPVR